MKQCVFRLVAIAGILPFSSGDLFARYYDARIGRFLSVDPKADTRAWLTPYHYARNNPLLYMDPDGMEEFKVIARTFIHWATYPGIILDNRAPSVDGNTFRTEQVIRVETNPRVSDNPILGVENSVSPTRVIVGRGNATISIGNSGEFSDPTGTRSDVNNGDNATVSFSGSAGGAGKAILGNIDYDFSISIVPGQTPTIGAQHGAFPAYEVHVIDSQGKVVGTYTFTPGSKWDIRYLQEPHDDVKKNDEPMERNP